MEENGDGLIMILPFRRYCVRILKGFYKTGFFDKLLFESSLLMLIDNMVKDDHKLNLKKSLPSNATSRTHE